MCHPFRLLQINFLYLPAGCRFSPHKKKIAPDHSPAVLRCPCPALDIFLSVFGCNSLGKAVNWSPRTSRGHMRGNIPHFVSGTTFVCGSFFHLTVSLRFPKTPRSAPVPLLRIRHQRMIQRFRATRILLTHIRLKNHLFRIDFFFLHISLPVLQFFPPVIHTKTPCFLSMESYCRSSPSISGTHLFPLSFYIQSHLTSSGYAINSL